ARQGYVVLQGETPVGEVLSGTFSPTLQAPIATALVASEALASGQPLTVQIRNQAHPADIVALPFYRRSS
ncbi:MAG: glycine cleavage T C-terminal barrel domain-containing protein, partial [Candidatus Sericytochromatia bacterium]